MLLAFLCKLAASSLMFTSFNIGIEGRGGDETDCRLKKSILCLKGSLQLIKQFSYECMNNGMTCSEHSAASQLHQNVNSEAPYSCNQRAKTLLAEVRSEFHFNFRVAASRCGPPRRSLSRKPESESGPRSRSADLRKRLISSTVEACQMER